MWKKTLENCSLYVKADNKYNFFVANSLFNGGEKRRYWFWSGMSEVCIAKCPEKPKSYRPGVGNPTARPLLGVGFSYCWILVGFFQKPNCWVFLLDFSWVFCWVFSLCWISVGFFAFCWILVGKTLLKSVFAQETHLWRSNWPSIKYFHIKNKQKYAQEWN